MATSNSSSSSGTKRSSTRMALITGVMTKFTDVPLHKS